MDHGSSLYKSEIEWPYWSRLCFARPHHKSIRGVLDGLRLLPLQRLGKGWLWSIPNIPHSHFSISREYHWREVIWMRIWSTQWLAMASWLAEAGNPDQESEIWCTWQPLPLRYHMPLWRIAIKNQRIKFQVLIAFHDPAFRRRDDQYVIYFSQVSSYALHLCSACSTSPSGVPSELGLFGALLRLLQHVARLPPWYASCFTVWLYCKARAEVTTSRRGELSMTDYMRRPREELEMITMA